MKRHVPALRQKGKVALGNLGKTNKVEAGVDIDDAAGVRAQKAHVVVRSDLDQLVLQDLALPAELTEPTCNDHCPGNTLASAIFEDGGHCLRRRSNEGQRHWTLDIENAAEAR